MRSVKARHPLEIWALSAIILVGAFIVSPGFFTIDEAIYYLGARAIAEHGSLGVDNGYALFNSESLRLRFLVDGPQGLTPQYPAGSALIAGPLLPFMGPRAFILPNALAAVLTLFTVRKICLSQFDSEPVARIAVALLVAGTFWIEYALGQWPHALSAFFAVQAYWFAIRHLNSDAGEYRYAILSGLFAGGGVLFRLDALLAVPAIGLILVLFAPRYIRSPAWFGVGVLPSFALMSGLNRLKFGSFNPLSYGQAGGNTDLASYGALFAALCTGLGVLLVWRKKGWSINPKIAIISCAVVGAILLIIPTTRLQLVQFWKGFVALVVDLRTVEDHRLGIGPGPGNTVSFVGLAKKALGQSMPWIGLTAMLVTAKIQKGHRRTIASLLVFIAVLIMPFIWLSWHGGGGSNMRYFLPALPALSILSAKLFHDLWQSVPNAMTFVAAGIWLVLGLGFAWYYILPSGYFGVQQILSTYVLLATVVAAIAAGAAWQFRQVARRLAIALFAGGLLMSTSFAISDFKSTASWRSTANSVGEVVATLPPKSLIITRPEWAAASMPGNGSIAAARNPATEQVDHQLVQKASDAGYRIFVTSFETKARRDVPPGFELLATSYSYPSGRIIELRRTAEAAPRQP